MKVEFYVPDAGHLGSSHRIIDEWVRKASEARLAYIMGKTMAERHAYEAAIKAADDEFWESFRRATGGEA